MAPSTTIPITPSAQAAQAPLAYSEYLDAPDGSVTLKLHLVPGGECIVRAGLAGREADCAGPCA